MLKELNFKFDHEAENITEALGISKETEIRCREIIYFCAFSNQLLGQELFPKLDERPKVLTTITGDLQKCVSFVKTEKELHYLLLIFNKFHTISIDSFAKYEALNEASDLEKRKIRLALEQIEIIMDEKAKKDEEQYISPIKVMNRIDCVKKSRYNFDKYLQIIEEEDLNFNFGKAFGDDI